MSPHGCLLLLFLIATPAPGKSADPRSVAAVHDSTPTAPPAAGTAAATPRSQKPRARDERGGWTVGVSLGRGHDDNVIQLTEAGMQVFNQRPGPPRFLIKSIGDSYRTAGLNLRWRGRPLHRRETRVQGGASLHKFDVDDVMDWQDYGLSLEQEITATRRFLSTGEVWWSHIPSYYLGESVDLDESVIAGRRVRNSLDYAQDYYGARLNQDLWSGRVSLNGSLERAHRDYGLHFPERTNDNDQFRLGAVVHPFRRWGASVRVSWLRGTLDARGDLPDTLGVIDRDISYHHDGVGVGVLLPWSHRVWQGRLDAALIPEQRVYTTADKFDVIRFGRVSDRQDWRVRLVERITGPFEAVVSWSRLTSRTHYTVPIDIDPSRTDFTENDFGVEVRASWAWRIR